MVAMVTPGSNKQKKITQATLFMASEDSDFMSSLNSHNLQRTPLRQNKNRKLQVLN
jgi:hypothetical protein